LAIDIDAANRGKLASGKFAVAFLRAPLWPAGHLSHMGEIGSFCAALDPAEGGRCPAVISGCTVAMFAGN
jgi:hypothetical protein